MTDPGIAIDYTPLGTNMESEDLTLPRDKFNRFRYFFVLRPRSTFLLVLALAIMTIGSFWLTIRRLYDVLVIFLPFTLVVTIVIFPGSALLEHAPEYVRKDTRNCINFLGEVVKFRPGLGVNKWNIIAARTNRAFHHNDNKITPYFFYDGAQCHSYFKYNYVETARFRKANGSENAKVGIQPMINRALKVYTDSLEEYWGEYMTEINDISEQSDVRNDSGKDQTVS